MNFFFYVKFAFFLQFSKRHLVYKTVMKSIKVEHYLLIELRLPLQQNALQCVPDTT